jgi:hypothetical protein
MLMAIHVQEYHAAAVRKAGDLVMILCGIKLDKAADQVERTIGETLADRHDPRECGAASAPTLLSSD